MPHNTDHPASNDTGSGVTYRHLLQTRGLDQPSTPATVTIRIPEETAGLTSTQQLAWVLVTLLTRSTPAIVERILIDCPPAVLLQPLVSPHADTDGTLLSTLLLAQDLAGPDPSLIHAYPERDGDPAPIDGQHLTFVLNATTETIADADHAEHAQWYVTGSGWQAEITRTPHSTNQPGEHEGLPFGPYIAACFAAAQVYLRVRARDYQPTPVTLDAWTWAVADQRQTHGTTRPAPQTLPVRGPAPSAVAVAIDAVLAGVGAVGSACLLAMWSTPGLTGIVRAYDDDPDGIEITNLNRCLPFTGQHVGHPKGPTAAAVLQRPGLEITGTHGAAEIGIDRATHLISAVDTPEARGALQDRYPASAIQASTRDLRLEVLRVDPASGSACLRCFNPPRQAPSDDELRAQLAAADAATVHRHADDLGIPETDIRAWTHDGECGTVGDRMLAHLREGTGHAAEFSVGFMSVLAGVLLAARAVQDAIARNARATGTRSETDPDDGTPTPVDAGIDRPRFVLNLLDPHTQTNGPRTYRRDRDCPSCAGVRRDLWLQTWTGEPGPGAP